MLPVKRHPDFPVESQSFDMLGDKSSGGQVSLRELILVALSGTAWQI